MSIEITNTFFDDLAGCIGGTAAVWLVSLHKGRTLYVPAQATEDHPIAKRIGYTRMQRLCGEFGNSTIDMPTEVEWERARMVRIVADMLQHGRTRKEIARLLGITERQVGNYRVIAEEMLMLPMVSRSKSPEGEATQSSLEMQFSGSDPEIPSQA